MDVPKGPSELEARSIRNGQERDAVFALRVEVFVVEQCCPPEEELDEYDAVAEHFVALWDGEVVGTARAYEVEGHLKIGRVAVKREYRGRGVGEALMRAAHEWAGSAGYEEAVLHAQMAVIGFYERLGYVAEGGVFYEAEIPHRLMRRPLP